MDWSHPDYRYDIQSKEDEEAFNRFLEFTDNQLKELATRYPTVKDFGLMERGMSALRKTAGGQLMSRRC